MKWIASFSFLVILFIPALTFSQDQKSEVLLTIGDEAVSREEFERIFLKNNQMVSEADKKSLNEYLELFINYKLKVVEAKANELHKLPSFINELDGYRKQLVQPYLNDPETEKRLIEEAYQRMRYEVSASHILISVSEKSTPEDTLAIYNKVLKIRERIKNGEPFENVARATSDDPSVKRNGGFLGYFSVFQMVYPFENAAYKTSTGEISMPVRSRFGYHIVKVHDKRAAKGQVKVAHIMVSVPQNPTPEQEKAAKEKFDMIYKEVINNEDFSSLARQYSDDPGSAKNGGELPWFGTGRMVPEFEQVAFALEHNGAISQPLRTAFGWHVIKRIDKKDVGSFEEMLPEIKQKITRDNRMQLSRQRFVENLKKQYSFSKDTNSLKAMVNMLDTNIYKGKWSLPKVALNQTLFEFAGKKHQLQELATKIEEFQKVPTTLPFYVIVERNFNELVDETILNFEENKLLSENLDFYYLMKEYHDGILLFEITDLNVWSKASTDTLGLKSFYNQNISKYQWSKRVHAVIYTAADESVAKKAHKLASSKKGQKFSNQDFAKQFISNGEEQVQVQNFAADPTHVTFKGRETWADGVSPISKTETDYSFVRIIAVKENENKPLQEIRGQVIADYQEHLEKEWLQTLKSKYSVKVNQDVFEKMAASLN